MDMTRMTTGDKYNVYRLAQQGGPYITKKKKNAPKVMVIKFL